MDTERLTICFELLQKLRASLESRLTNWVKVAISASLMCVVVFLPLNCFSRTPVLYLCSHRIEIENNSILVEFSHLGVFSRFDIYWLPTSNGLSKGYTLF